MIEEKIPQLDNSNKKAIIVLGSGRCGTSLLMQVLEKLGMSTSKDLVVPSEQNPIGGYEDRTIFELQNALLKAASVDAYIPLNEDWLKLPEVSKISEELRAIVQENVFKAETIWGFKDPKTVLFLPLWVQIFNKLKITPIYIYTLRHPAQVVLSMKKHYKTSEALSELFWLNKNIDALRHTGSNCYIIHYEDWFTICEDIANELFKYTTLNTFYPDKNISGALQGVIKESLNRSVYEDYEVQNQYVIRLYEVLKKCRGKDFDRVELMESVKQCRKAIKGFQGWYQHAQNLLARERKLTRQIESNSDALQKIKEEKRVLKKEIENSKNIQKDLEKKLYEEMSSLKQDKIKELEINQGIINELKIELEKMVMENNTLLIESKNLFDETENYRMRLAALGQDPKNLHSKPSKERNKNTRNYSVSNKDFQLRKWKKEAVIVKYSYSFRLGQILINTFTKPGKNTLLLPYYLFELALDMISGRGREKVKKELDEIH